jgi:hypothetical protein
MLANPRVEAILEQRRQRALALEREARERDPHQGTGARTIALLGVTLLALGAGIVASFSSREPSPPELVAFLGVVLALLLVGAYGLRKRLLDTVFNRQVFSCLVISMGVMLFGRLVGLFVEVPAAVHFARDSFVTAGVMAVCAASMLRWTFIIALIFGITGTLRMVFPEQSLQLFVFTTVIAMALATVTSWWSSRRAS